jgi:hypothetical protein
MAGSRLRSKTIHVPQKAAAPTGVRRRAPKHRQPGFESQVVIQSDLPAKLCPTKAELALWRAFLAEEIDAILRDDGE